MRVAVCMKFRSDYDKGQSCEVQTLLYEPQGLRSKQFYILRTDCISVMFIDLRHIEL